MFDKERQRQMALNQTQALMKSGFQPPANPVPIKKIEGPKDMNGTEFKIGMRVARSVKIGNTNGIRVCEVTHIAGPQVYLDNSMRSIGRPDLLLVLR